MCDNSDHEPDLRPFVVSEIDQMLAGIQDGNKKALSDARDWLADLVLDGDADVICTMLRGWSSEMSKGMAGEW